MIEKLRIVIPTGGWATRMRPHSWSKPKPLIGVAGRTSLDYLLDSFQSIPAGTEVEYIIIVEPHLGMIQIPAHMQENHPGMKIQYALQTEMRGQSDALWQARSYLTGPTLMCFSDTLLDTDFSFLAAETADAVAFVHDVPDPRRFGVAEEDHEGWVTHLIEKPQSLENHQVVVGCYYFREGEALLEAVEEQFRRDIQLRGEYYLADAINILLEQGTRMRTHPVDIWLDTGTVEALLETNRYLLDRASPPLAHRSDSQIVPPVFIHEDAVLADSVVGPHVSIGAGCQVSHSRIENSILEAGAVIESVSVKDSLVGRQARVVGRTALDPPLLLNLGDNSSVLLK